MKVLFLGLKIFSASGGIEQVNKNFLFAFNSLEKKNKLKITVISMYDKHCDTNYIDEENFIACKSNKWVFGFKSLWSSINADVIMISHLNLSLFALIAKLINPRLKIIVQLHGIEAWANLSGLQERLLKQADKILAVSKFTADSILKRYPEVQDKTSVFHNSLDPLKSYGVDEPKGLEFRAKLNIGPSKILIITIGRLLRSEAYKGYDKTIESIAKLNNENLVFHIIGKYEEEEAQRIRTLISKFNLDSQVFLIGFVSDVDLDSYYQAADLFVMPSKGEGFGLVFIDAMANGLRVIAGNIDGSVDAVASFNESYTVNPEDTDEIAKTINGALKIDWNTNDKIALSDKCKFKFSAQQFEKNTEKLIL